MYTEPNKVGIKIIKKYTLEIDKYKINSSLKIQGVTYLLKYQDTNQEGENLEKTKILTTDNNGKIILDNLYVEKQYELKEISVPDNCNLNPEKITFKVNSDKSVNINGTVKNYSLDSSNKLKLELENEIKYKLNLVKQDEQENYIKGVKFVIKGIGFSESGKVFTTSNSGNISINALQIGETYTLEEKCASGYYLDINKNNTINFKIDRNAQTNKLEITTWTVGDGIKQVGTQEIVENDNSIEAVLNIVLENEKIPTYNLKILKVNKKEEPLMDAQFTLTSKDTGKKLILTTNNAGEVLFSDLYEFIDGKCITGEYSLKEVYAPNGYSVNDTELVFKATRDENGKIQITTIQGDSLVKVDNNTKNKEVTSDTSTLTLKILNTPIFNLTKIGDNNNLLPNAKFAISDIGGNDVFDIEGNKVGKEETIDGVTYNVITTNEDGKISINLPAGKYKLIEVEAPQGYELPKKEKDRTHYFGIDKSQKGSQATGESFRT